MVLKTPRTFIHFLGKTYVNEQDNESLSKRKRKCDFLLRGFYFGDLRNDVLCNLYRFLLVWSVHSHDAQNDAQIFMCQQTTLMKCAKA